MPKLGMEPIRREALVAATIAEIGAVGTLDVTVARIAKRAGMSCALAHHYFGGKDQILVAAMRQILTLFGVEVRGALAMADTPRARIDAVVRASFSPVNFRPEVIGAWLAFYVQAQTSKEARRLLGIYRCRMRSNLLVGLRPLVADRAETVAQTIGALIDGVYIRQALRHDAMGGEDAVKLVQQCVEGLLDSNRKTQ